jgi:multidrug efflux pump subunit AcrA (membrane-fusion protein)
MNRRIVTIGLGALVAFGPLAVAACSTGNAKATETPAAAVVDVSSAAAVEQPIARFVRATGTLMAEDQADVAAETAGRVVATPIERGSRIAEGGELARVVATETNAQLKEAEANAAQIEARLGLSSDSALDVNNVPEVQTAKASYELAQGEFNRIKSLLDQRVVSQSEYDQRRTQMEATRQQYESAKNAAAQQYQSLQAARARIAMARKAVADTVVRAPFSGVVAERLVSVGDYVTKGMKVAVVVRVNPLRVMLTIPEQFVSSVAAGQAVDFEVDAYPGRRFTGTVKYISPSLQADRRALTVEAVVPNQSGDLKPGLFATARLEQSAKTPGVVVPSAAVQTSAGTSRVFVLMNDHVEERIVVTGQVVGDLVEITKGLTAGEKVATTNLGKLNDGTKIKS